MIGFLYPGQGAQYIGMGIDFYDASKEVQELFKKASELAGFDVYRTLTEGSAEEISQTDKSQVLITVVNLAARIILEVIPEEQGAPLQSALVAGFSLGEYAALADAGVIQAEDALAIVQTRGIIMEKHARSLDSQEGKAGMMAVLGLDAAEILEAIAPIEQVYAAMFNSPQQTVLAGTAKGLQAARNALSHARRCVMLAVSGPFHTPLMKNAKEEFAAVLQRYSFRTPKKPIYSNVTGAQETDASMLRRLCAEQLVSPVQWTKTMQSITESAITTLYEVGPGRVLQGLWNNYAKIDTKAASCAVVLAGTMRNN